MADEIITKVPRFDIAPTDDKLKSDAIKLCQRVFDLWDGEVDCTVVLSRRDDPKHPMYATTVRFKDHIKVQMEGVRDSAMRDLKKVSDRG